MTSSGLQERIDWVNRIELGPKFEEFETEVAIAYKDALETLTDAFSARAAFDAHEAENARLRAALAEQEAKEASARAEQEQKDRDAARSLAIAQAALVAAEAESRRLQEAETRRLREAEEKAAEDARIAEAQKDFQLHQEKVKAERAADKERIEKEALGSLTEFISSSNWDSLPQLAFELLIAITHGKIAHVRIGTE